MIQRKALLKKTINGTDIQFSESFAIDGGEMYARLQGGPRVSKVRDSGYASGRGNNWVKKTCAHARRSRSQALRSTATTGTASISAAAKATL